LGAWKWLDALGPAELAKAIGAEAARYIEGIDLRFNGTRVAPSLAGVEVPEVGDVALSRQTVVRLAGDVPKAARALTFIYAESFGSCVLRVREGVHDTDQLLVVTGGRGSSPPRRRSARSPSATWFTSRPASATATARRRIRRCRTLSLLRPSRSDGLRSDELRTDERGSLVSWAW
jgi:hypothetical protein